MKMWQGKYSGKRKISRRLEYPSTTSSNGKLTHIPDINSAHVMSMKRVISFHRGEDYSSIDFLLSNGDREYWPFLTEKERDKVFYEIKF